MELIHERVQVGAVFGPRGVRPVWFLWNGRRIAVRDVTYVWRDREGSAPLWYCTVSDGTDMYELCFHAESMQWMLTRVEVNEDLVRPGKW